MYVWTQLQKTLADTSRSVRIIPVSAIHRLMF